MWDTTGVNVPIPWCFSSRVTADRRLNLESVASFDEIIQRIATEAKVVSFDIKRGKEGALKTCLRPQFEIKVSQSTADLFFNSSAGYRANYLADPDEGQKQNGRLLAALEPLLVSFAIGKTTKQTLSREQVQRSIFGCSAKIWLTEGDLKFNHDLIEDIYIPAWRANALAALAAFAQRARPNPEEQEKAIWGLRAPIATILDIKGAFLDEEQNEVVPFQKICRRHQIHAYGFT